MGVAAGNTRFDGWVDHVSAKAAHDVSDEPRDEAGRWTDGGGDGNYTQSSPADFIAARNKSTRANFMSPLKPEDLSNHTLITTKDLKAGVAVDSQGDLQNLYNNGGPKGIGADLIAAAIRKGAKTLDCYDGYLPGFYAQMGFVETGRLKFDVNYAHDWDTNKQGTPDVVFMAWKGYNNGDEKAAIARAKSTASWVPHERSENYPADYDTAKEQSRAVAGRAKNHRYAGKESGSATNRAGDQFDTRSGARSRQFVKAAHDVSDEPRDPHGRWTDDGGEDDGGEGDGKGKHPGKGYSAGAYVDKHGVIQTNNVYDAQRALFEDRRVELKQVKQISTLIKRLGETAAEMAEHGETAPVFNLCNVTVKGTNLFCADQIGIPRAEMPVIPAKRTKEFIKYLKDQGYKIEKDKEQSRNLRASQSEISGAKVAAQMARIKERGFYKRLVISRDDYILDGHHTWAGQLGIDAKDGDLENDDRAVKVARVDISITKLIAEAEKWTKEQGIAKKPASEAPKGYQFISMRQAQYLLDAVTFRQFADTAYRFLAANGNLAQGVDDILITVPKGFDPNEPRDEQGRWTEGGGGGAGATEAAKPKGKAKVSSVGEFNKKGIRLDPDTTINKAKQEKFLQRWNDTIAEAPEDFKNEFLGGIPATMKIEYNEDSDKLYLEGKLQDEHGDDIGEYRRYLNLKDKNAYSAYFVMKRAERGGGVGKKLLAANVAMYQKLGFDKVTVSANIDVGGYSWARYGYVPTPQSWNTLRNEIREKLEKRGDRTKRAALGEGYTPESWDEVGEHDRSQIESAWMRSTYSEFEDSEIQNWRDSGQALEDAKSGLASGFTGSEKWAVAALQEWRNKRDDEGVGIPFTNEQILSAVSIENYSSRYGEGKDDPDISIDDDALKDESQPALPGLEAPPLSEDTKDEIIKALQDGFNDEAESQAQDADPPDYISDSVSQYQGEYWDSMRDRDKFDWAERNSELPEYPIEDDDEAHAEPVETTDPQREALLKLARSSDPKAIWAIADSAQGKELLLNTSWSGVLNFKDKQTMDRFHAYVGKKK